MDPGIQLTADNPHRKANILSRLCFTWMIGLFRKGVKYGLKVSDLYKTLDRDKSDMLGDKLELNWMNEIARAKKKNEDPSLVNAISKTFLGHYMMYGILLFVQFVVLRSFQPVVLGYLISLFAPNIEDDGDNQTKMYISGAVLVLISLVVIFFNHHCNFGQSAIGMRVRIAVSSLVYRKLLKLSKKSLGQTAAGQVVNLLSNDVSRFDYVSIALHYIWIAPFQVAVVAYFIWEQVGISCLSGILAMILLTLPVQGYLGKLTSSVRSKIAVRTDNRVRLMNEIISGIQVIKMYAWEKPFQKMVRAIRASEIKVLTTSAYLRGIFLSCMVFIERTTLYLTVITYVLLDNVITADKVFSMSQFFNLLQLALAIFLPMAISFGAETVVSIRRLQTFLVMEEKALSNIDRTSKDKINLTNVNASWTSEKEHLTLNGLNLTIPAGKLCAIVGPVGSGKSSILQLLLGELPTMNGQVSLCGDISYSSQEPWLFVSNVRNNILFGQEYNKELYKKVTKVCALLPDFDQFPQRDKTMVGERGVSLSGGQRARINLARAVYRSADIYLMDDPLSAVDTHVGKHLFEECIVNYLKGKTRILVTHQLQYLKKADIIVVMNEGKIEAQGTFEELSKSDFSFTKMMVAADETSEKKQQEAEKPKQLQRNESTKSIKSIKSIADEDMPEKDEEEIGLAGKSATKEYLKAAGNCCTLFMVALVIILGQVSCSGADYWVSFWTEHEQIKHKDDPIITVFGPTVIERFVDYVSHKSREMFNSDSPLKHGAIYYTYDVVNKSSSAERKVDWDEIFGTPMDTYAAIYVYTAIIVAIIILTLVRSFAFFKITMIASENLHSMMFNSLLQAPMRFFDTNPSGRVLNRFSKDMGAVDELLPRVTMEAMQIMLVMVGILVMIAISNYYMIIAMVVFIILFIFLRKWYLTTVKVIKHLEGITKSPVFSHLNSSLNGITTIRASHAEKGLIKEFDHHQDAHTSAWFLTIACTSSFGLWIDMVCVIFTAVVTFSFIFLNLSGDVSGSMVGLAISQSLILTGMLQHGMRQTAEVVNQMASVERVLHYTTLDMEGPFIAPKDELVPKEWPSTGDLKFKHMSMKYTPHDPPVLKDLHLDISSGEKIGIVGRTGAGKSSLISALFRLAPLEGTIVVDELETHTLGLTTLRQKIAIIPQEPVLFSATLRYNLDPFNQFTDDALWFALDEVELKESVPSLDFIVDEGGANFSLGQRQLVCLARAILRNNKILVLDEATANVDPGTDALIQTTIRKKFANCTVLTIAHRLNTIMDSDKVLVMDAGRMIEFEHPHLLLQKPEGHFTKMVEQTGPTMTKTLREVALDAYNKTHPNVAVPS
ncbi:PREDICTED: multidrug resistance-associated protein 4 [Nicrophorus vespilloides]|uniref:Multidrug resistance-associated protein 4 n=1 Tax=Nicrophorus vespilloides TaxID=110193 RepID=A0ABM1MU50_NICVS|nr:PREDICTED: multidrug resistance-associated protein 4 [Nicrophorus vespilloides]